ncbi:hypothetical protein EXU29_06940 [Acinetobacter wuhouensis]|uniref:DUF6670 family protein n=1 Tax=Acinetobacter wuhouensis TaxID=1879050 RepID=UPI0010233A52|nr:DUF6670 family protein [Acinetobacter wuhouensis]RZG73435.1 hypothetical protein EXU29_06940 [Acinetobacter wuhouensis]
MRLFQDFLDQSRQLNQAQKPIELQYHPPKDKYKIIHQKLVIADLPAPLHYFNFFSFMGQPNSAVFCNQSEVSTSALDTATVLVSSSPHMLGQLNSYSIKNDCQFSNDENHQVSFEFGQKEKLFGKLPSFEIQRQDDELSFNLKVTTMPLVSYFSYLKFGFAEHWSLLAHCEGAIQFKQEKYQIQQMGAFEYLRMVNFPYLPHALYVYQLVQLSEDLQMICMHSRDQMNSILYSRIYLRDAQNNQMTMLDKKAHFNIDRVFPKIKTPNQQEMYLPREFGWQYQDKNIQINLEAQSRGDYKFGLGAGYVGSFSYQLQINEDLYQGESGYCEYIDCRPLKWQEIDKENKAFNKSANPALIMLKK